MTEKVKKQDLKVKFKIENIKISVFAFNNKSYNYNKIRQELEKTIKFYKNFYGIKEISPDCKLRIMIYDDEEIVKLRQAGGEFFINRRNKYKYLIGIYKFNYLVLRHEFIHFLGKIFRIDSLEYIVDYRNGATMEEYITSPNELRAYCISNLIGDEKDYIFKKYLPGLAELVKIYKNIEKLILNKQEIKISCDEKYKIIDEGSEFYTIQEILYIGGNVEFATLINNFIFLIARNFYLLLV